MLSVSVSYSISIKFGRCTDSGTVTPCTRVVLCELTFDFDTDTDSIIHHSVKYVIHKMYRYCQEEYLT